VRQLAFFALAAGLIAASLTVVLAKSLFRAAFALSAALVATAGLYVLLSAPLLAAVQILLYTGGVLTLVVFALVVAGGNVEETRFRHPVPAVLMAASVFVALLAPVRVLAKSAAALGLGDGKAVGLLLFRDYLVPFELLSVLLLAAVFGALMLARKDRPA
jgi:NADH:ubiquinone oxidoreductase subunit 6 (subunit J)